MSLHDLTPLLGSLGVGWLLAASVMLATWIVQVVRRNATLVDIAWAANLGLLAVLYARLSPGLVERRILIALLAGLWALRLSSFLFVDRALGRPEDGRYQALREVWGTRANLNFFVFFQAQALLDVVLSLPFALVCMNPASELHALEWAGAALWLVAISGESLADLQLARFKRDPSSRGKTCRRGLWKYSRHPNYFFEWLHWIAFALFALAAPHGWLALSSPAIMLYLLFRVTGIPATETQAVKSRGADYIDYQRTTSAFVPWFQKG
jgi:steroid 5-alpha reductase family enzyme